MNPARAESKLAAITKLLYRNEGATIAQMVEATGWQKHGLTIASIKTDGVRVYRITDSVDG